MTIQIKHAFVSLKGDGTDATQVQPSNWNAAHSTSIATGNLIGRLSAGAGAFEEIPISAYMASILNTADQATLAGVLGLFETGDVKFTFKTTAAAGWLLMTSAATASNTIGNAASGATLRANADTQALFVLLYNALADGLAPVSGGRTGNAVNDFNSNKTITLPSLVGRAPIGAGAGAGGITTRVNGTPYGNETYTILTANLPAYTPSGSITGITVTSSRSDIAVGASSSTTGGGAFGFAHPTTFGSIVSTGTGNFNGNAQGGTSTPHTLMQPSMAMNVMVKL